MEGWGEVGVGKGAAADMFAMQSETEKWQMTSENE